MKLSTYAKERNTTQKHYKATIGNFQKIANFNNQKDFIELNIILQDGTNNRLWH